MDVRNGEVKRSVLVAQRSIVAIIQWCSADARPLPAPRVVEFTPTMGKAGFLESRSTSEHSTAFHLTN